MEEPPKQTMRKIRRTRTGCETCRRRRIKCDERKPFCKACCRLGLDCLGYPSKYKFVESAAPIQPNATMFRTHESKAWGSSPVFSILRSSNSPSVHEEPRKLSPINGSAFGITPATDYADDDSTMGSVGNDWEPSVGSNESPTTSYAATSVNFEFDDNMRSGKSTTRNSSESPSTLLRSGPKSDSSSRLIEDPYLTKHSTCVVPSCVRLAPLRSPKTDSSILEDFYLAKWYSSAVACLPPVFNTITADMSDFPPLRNALLAISASYLAHIESSTVTTNVGGRKSRYIPQSEHRYRSLIFYDRGVKELSEIVLTSQPVNMHYVLATSLIFQYFEIDTGSIVGVGGYMESIDNIALSAWKDLNTNPIGQSLLCTWLALRSLVVCRCLSMGLGLTKLPPFATLNEIDDLMSKAATPYDSIMQTLCNSISLIRVIVLDWCVCRGKSYMTPEKKHNAFAAVLDQVSLPMSRDCSVSELAAIDDCYWKPLEQQRAKLDDWHGRLHMSELPIDSFTSLKDGIAAEDLPSGPEIQPLRFQTHDAAMNYLYYALAQMLSSRLVMERLASTGAPPTTFTSSNYLWEHLILRITQGLNLEECAANHVFKFGTMTILSMCAAWCPHICVAHVAERWLSQLEACGMAVEDGIPIALIKRELSFIIEKKKSGQDVLRTLVLANLEMETGELYRGDFQIVSAICAKDRRTGRLYNGICEIP